MLFLKENILKKSKNNIKQFMRLLIKNPYRQMETEEDRENANIVWKLIRKNKKKKRDALKKMLSIM